MEKDIWEAYTLGEWGTDTCQSNPSHPGWAKGNLSKGPYAGGITTGHRARGSKGMDPPSRIGKFPVKSSIS